MACYGMYFTFFLFHIYSFYPSLGVEDALNARKFVCCFVDGDERFGLTQGDTFLAVRFGNTYQRLKKLLVPLLRLFRWLGLCRKNLERRLEWELFCCAFSPQYLSNNQTDRIHKQTDRIHK
jgi:hypothetical protein